MKKIIVIGGGAAGAKAASKAKRLNPNNYVELYTEEDVIAFSLCGLPYFIEGSVNDINKLIVKTPKDFTDMGIQVYLNHKLEEIYPEKNSVLINGDVVFYDKLILALGARVKIPNIENIEKVLNSNNKEGNKNVFTLRSIKSALEIKEKMKQSKSVLLIGGGYIALELAEAFISNNLDVTIIEANARIANDFDSDFSEIIQNVLENNSQNRLKLFCNEQIIKFNLDENNNFISAVSNTGKIYEADFCVLSTGTYPNTEVARRAGIRLGSTGAIYTSSKMRTNFENIFAAGDCTQETCLISRTPVCLGLGTIANKEGRVAAINSSGEYELFEGILGSIITRFFDYTISKTGLSYKRAQELAKIMCIEPIQATITKKDRAGYMPDNGEISIKLVADKRDGTILGAQAVGKKSNVAQRINTISAALKTRSTIEDILHLDLPYAPPISGSIDPILTAAYKLKDEMMK